MHERRFASEKTMNQYKKLKTIKKANNSILLETGLEAASAEGMGEAPITSSGLSAIETLKMLSLVHDISSLPLGVKLS